MQRLWCLWELFNLFTFNNKELALDRIVILRPPVNRKKGQWSKKLEEEDAFINSLHAFTINDAHCFSPNEELKLRHLMLNVIGSDSTTLSVRKLATKKSSSSAVDFLNFLVNALCTEKPSYGPSNPPNNKVHVKGDADP